MTYLLDANTLIESKNRYYAFAICPGFWNWLDDVAGNGDVVSIDRVYKELIGRDDDLKTWVKERRDEGRFLPTDDGDTQNAFANLVSAVTSRDYTDKAKREFASTEIADPWLIAKAKVIGGTVVTQETSELQRRNKVKIPDACSFLGVPSMGLFQVLHDRPVTFVYDYAPSG